MTRLLLAISAGALAWFLTRSRHAPVRPLSERERRRLDCLQPEVRAKVVELRQRLADRGIQTFVGQTCRTLEQQREGLKEGRTATIRSWHLVQRAVDMPVVDARGNVRFDLKTPWVREAYQVLGEEAQKMGFRWLGLGELCGPGGCFRDPWHLEYRGGLTWAQAARDVGLDPTRIA